MQQQACWTRDEGLDKDEANDFRIDRRRGAFLWRDQDSNPGVCETNSPADCPLKKRLSYCGNFSWMYMYVYNHKEIWISGL